MEEPFDIRNNQNTEREFENALRPLSFHDFKGQEKIVENLKIFVAAARMRTESLDHVLLHGPPGLGKTTLSNIIANELNVGFKVTSGPVLDKPGDLAGLLTSLETNDVLFIDEIHNITGAGDSEGAMNAANILKPALSRGEIQVIGATTFAERRVKQAEDAVSTAATELDKARTALADERAKPRDRDDARHSDGADDRAGGDAPVAAR